MTIGKRIKSIRSKLGYSQVDFAEKINVSKQTLYKYENDIITNIPSDKIENIARIGNISPAYLMGWEEEKLPKDAIPIPEQASLPVLGKVCAGNGILAHEEILYYEPADTKYATGEYFYLRVKGDSMAPQICEEDLVLVKHQTSVDSGDVAVVLVDGTEGMVKKVVYDETNIHLISFNPYYPEKHFKDAEVLRVSVIGKVIESKRKWA